MPHPELYAWYAGEEVPGLFGQPDEVQRLCGGQWLIFAKTAVCLAHIDAGARSSYFDAASTFCWVADQPYRVNDDPLRHFLPPQVLGAAGKGFSIRLFVRPPQTPKYLYAGELNLSYSRQSPRRGAYGMACFRLNPALPSKVWVELGGLRLGDMDVAAVDLALDRLRRPTTVQDRLGILQRLVDYWHGPIRPRDGMSDADLAGIALPLPLRWWYRWAGKRTEILSGQNHLFVPRDPRRKHGELFMEGGRLRFYAENQGVYQWATLPDGDDPPVFGRYENMLEWQQEDVTLSEHLACLFEAVMCHANYSAGAAWLDEHRVAEIVKTIPPLAISPWRWMGARFFARGGAFMCVAENGKPTVKTNYSAWIGAKTEHPLQFLKPLLNERWEQIAF